MLVGRDMELRRLGAMLEGTIAGSGRLVRIVGEPGIGKTRLADELASIASQRGVVVAWGRCWEAGGAPAFWPWEQIQRTVTGGAPSPLASLAGANASGTSSPADAEQLRFRIFDELSQRLARASAEAPLLIVVDDAHAADVPSLHLLRFVARGLRGARMMIVVTQREIEPRLKPEIGVLLGKIARDGESITLGRLSENDIAEWLRGAGRPESSASRVHRATEGNPLFVQELLELPPDAAWTPGASDTVRAAIGEHLARLSAHARVVLEAAAVLGREAARGELAAIADTPAAIDAALAEGTSLGVVEMRGDGRIAFRHILLRDDLYGSLGPARRAELHARAAEAFTRRADLGDDDALARAAHHDVEAARAGGDVTRAVTRVRRAAARALALVAYEQAAELLESAVALLELRGAVDDANGAALLIELGEALVLSGMGERGRDLCARAAAIAKAVDEKSLVVQAALVYGSELLTGRRDERMIALLRDAMEAVGPGDSAARARVMSRLASALIPLPADNPEPSRLANAAITMARNCGDKLALLHTLQFSTGGLAFRAGVPERRSLIEETLALAVELDRPAIAAMSFPWAIASDLEVGDTRACDRRIADLERLTERMPQASYRARLPLAIAMRASLTGDWSAADVALAEVKLLAQSSETPLPAFLLSFASVCHHFARLDGARLEADTHAIEAVLRHFVAGRAFNELVTAIRAASGTIPIEEARARAVPVVREAMGVMRVEVLPAAGPAAYTAVLVRDRDLASEFFDIITKAIARGEQMIFMAGCAGTLGPTTLLLAEICALLDRKEEAARHYDDAIAFSESIGATLYAARARSNKAKLRVATAARASTPTSVRPASTPPASTPPAAPPPIALAQDGEMWTLRAGDESWHLKPSKGLSYLATLLAHPHEELHVAQLVGDAEEVTGDAGPMLDAAAKESYRRRAGDLRAALDEATAHADSGRAERVRAELDALGEELARAVGLGGRDRKAASDVERMRVNVQRRLKDAIERVRAQSPAIGRYLDASVRTGSFCSFAPAWIGKES